MNKEPRGLRNNNPLNLEKGNNWQGERACQTDRRFEEFISLEYGLRAGFIIIRNYMKLRPPMDTVRKIITRWAPPSENDTAHYIQVVCTRGYLEPDAKLRFSDKQKICRLIWAMCYVECGQEISFGRVENAYALACRS